MSASDEFVIDVAEVAEAAMEMGRARDNCKTALEEIYKVVNSIIKTSWTGDPAVEHYATFLKLNDQVEISLHNIGTYIVQLREVADSFDSLTNNLVNKATEVGATVKDWVFGV